MCLHAYVYARTRVCDAYEIAKIKILNKITIRDVFAQPEDFHVYSRPERPPYFLGHHAQIGNVSPNRSHLLLHDCGFVTASAGFARGLVSLFLPCAASQTKRCLRHSR